MAAGKLPASPRPSRKRISAKPAAAPEREMKATPSLSLITSAGTVNSGSLCAKACPAAARLQSAMNTVKPSRNPMPSMIRPATSMPIA